MSQVSVNLDNTELALYETAGDRWQKIFFAVLTGLYANPKYAGFTAKDLTEMAERAANTALGTLEKARYAANIGAVG